MKTLFNQYKTKILLLMMALFFAVPRGQANAQEIDYYSYTLFLYNFSKYVNWPGSTPTFTIAVLGNSPILKELEKLAKTKKSAGRTIIIKIVNTIEEAEGSNMLYIPSAKSAQIKAISLAFKGKPTLIVGERDGLARKGAAIDFFMDEDETLRFSLNRRILESHQLKISGELLPLAELVE